MVTNAKRGGVEYLERLVKAGRISPMTTFRGELLDEVGDTYRMQRRIVESSCD